MCHMYKNCFCDVYSGYICWCFIISFTNRRHGYQTVKVFLYLVIHHMEKHFSIGQKSGGSGITRISNSTHPQTDPNPEKCANQNQSAECMVLAKF